MKKLTLLLSVLVVLAFAVTACATDADDQYPGPGPEFEGELPETGVDPFATPGVDSELPDTGDEPLETAVIDETAAPLATEEPLATEPTEVAAVDTTPEVTESAVVTGTAEVRGAAITPADQRSEAARLSSLLAYQVEDSSGNQIGTVSDMVLNTCEAHILYLVVDRTDAEAGGQMLVPYEAVTLYNGRLDVEMRSIALNLEVDAFADAPTVDAMGLDMTDAAWESDVQTYWSDITPLTLSTECDVEGFSESTTSEPVTTTETMTTTETVTGTEATTATGSVFLALASDILGADLQDGTGATLGMVEEVIIEPESGQMRYIVLQAEDAPGDADRAEGERVLVPMRAVNIDHEAASDPVLVLLVETSVLDDAPRITDLSPVLETSWDEEAFGYWSDHVILTEDEMDQ